MAVSTFDLFKIGVGPSSSHTVGPMRAACRFAQKWIDEAGNLSRTARVRAEVFGSLALTGRGHGTDKAVLMGLEGHWPNEIDPDVIPAALERIRAEKRIRLLGVHAIGFDEKRDLVMNKRQKLPFHTNGMRFTAYDADGNEIATRDYYSVGGGFVVNQDEAAEDRIVADTTPLPHPFSTGAELLAECERSGLSIARMMFENEKAWRDEDAIRAGLREIWQAMQACVERGVRSTVAVLPGGLKVARRAPQMYAVMSARPEAAMKGAQTVLDWVNLYARAAPCPAACTCSAAHNPPAAIEHATPTSPWQPTSAPEIEAFSL
jgi:L-serine dehydratase